MAQQVEEVQIFGSAYMFVVVNDDFIFLFFTVLFILLSAFITSVSRHACLVSNELSVKFLFRHFNVTKNSELDYRT